MIPPHHEDPRFEDGVVFFFASLRQIRSIRSCIPQLHSRRVAVVSRLDYGSATLAGLPANSTDRLQSVLNAAARFFYSRRRYDHVMQLLRELRLR